MWWISWVGLSGLKYLRASGCKCDLERTCFNDRSQTFIEQHRNGLPSSQPTSRVTSYEASTSQRLPLSLTRFSSKPRVEKRLSKRISDRVRLVRSRVFVQKLDCGWSIERNQIKDLNKLCETSPRTCTVRYDGDGLHGKCLSLIDSVCSIRIRSVLTSALTCRSGIFH